MKCCVQPSVRITNAERTNLHDLRVVTCCVCGCKIVAASVSMLDQYRYRRFYVRALTSRSRSPSQLRLLTPKTRPDFYVFLKPLFLASTASHNFITPRLIGACFLLPFREYFVARIKSTFIVASVGIKGDVPASTSSFRRKVDCATPSPVGARLEIVRLRSNPPFVFRRRLYRRYP